MSDRDLARNDIGDVTISIGGGAARQPITGWSGFQVIRGLDQAADAFSFSFPWEATEENRLKFRAYRTSLIRIWHKDSLILTGRMEKLAPTWAPDRAEITLEGRGASGFLLDIDAVPGEYAAPFNTVSSQLIPDEPTKVFVAARPNQDVFVTVDPGTKVWDVLSRTAASRGLWAVPQTDGNLVFQKIQPEGNVEITEGISPVVSIATSHDLTQRFYRYQAIRTNDGDIETVEEIDRGVDPVRSSKIIETSEDADITETARFARARGIIDSYTCQVTVSGWTQNGELWRPGLGVEIFAPSAMMYNRRQMIVRRATFQIDESGGAITQLELTFPEAYSGNDVQTSRYPWSVAS